MTDEELIKRLRDCGNGMGSFKTNQGDYGLCDDAADRIGALLDVRDTLRRLVAKRTARAERLEAAIDYILNGMAINAPDYEIGPDDEFLDAADNDWVRDVLSRLAAAMKGADHE